MFVCRDIGNRLMTVRCLSSYEKKIAENDPVTGM